MNEYKSCTIDTVSYGDMVKLCRKHYRAGMHLVELTRLVVGELTPIDPVFDCTDIQDRNEYIRAAASVGCKDDGFWKRNPTRLRTWKEAQKSMEAEARRRREAGLIEQVTKTEI